MPSLTCPLCSLSLTASSLEAHLRQELLYPALCCLLCKAFFASQSSAHEHFEGPLAQHRGEPLRVLHLEREPVKEARLLELMRLARGGEETVQKRLCVCGECQLVCREEQGSIGQRETEPHDASEADNQSWQPVEVAEEQHHERAHEHMQEKDLPTEEPSEPENMMDMKQDLKDLKPQISADGKVACIQCGLRVTKERFKDHVLGPHSTTRHFSCKICPHTEKSKTTIGVHLRKVHKVPLSSEAFTFIGSEAKIEALVEQCFGAPKSPDWARMRCIPCDRLINKKHLKNHAATDHLDKALHACRLCPYTSKRFSAEHLNLHVKNVHKRQPGPDTIDSSQAKHYEPILKNMIPRLFFQE